MTDTNDLRQQPALPDIETRIPTAAEVDERTGNVSSREYRGGFNDCRLVFAQPTIDRLQSALAAAQRRIATLGQQPAQPGSGDVVPRSRYNAANKDWLDEKAAHEKTRQAAADEIDRLQAALTAAQRERDEARSLAFRNSLVKSMQKQVEAGRQRIAELERELENELARGIHTCHDQCERPLCVAQRRIAALESGLSEAIEIMTQGERLLPKGESRFRLILEGKEPA